MKDINRVLNPANRYDQITGSMDFICEHAGYDSPIGTKRWHDALQTVAFYAVAANIVSGYNFKVLQRAIKDHMAGNGVSITPPQAPYTHEELYES